MRSPIGSRRAALAATLAITLAGTISACGGGSEQTDPAPGQDRANAQLAPVKDYLLERTGQLAASTRTLQSQAQAYHDLAARADFDYARLLRDDRDAVRDAVRALQRTYVAANPQYETMEGVVAGVPELADFDVIIDAGGDAQSDSPVPFDIAIPGGRTYERPGNLFGLVESSAYGTDERFVARGVTPDLDGDGKVRFGEALPDAKFMLATAKEFARQADELDAAAKDWQPTLSDAFTALVVMTPTMSEYFESWKASRFVAGGKSTETTFVAASRLQDIADIFGGLTVIYDAVRPQVATVSDQQATQTGAQLRSLQRFAADLRDREERGTRFSPEQADTLGREAQGRAEAIAGQISQAAATLKIDLEA